MLHQLARRNSFRSRLWCFTGTLTCRNFSPSTCPLLVSGSTDVPCSYQTFETHSKSSLSFICLISWVTNLLNSNLKCLLKPSACFPLPPFLCGTLSVSCTLQCPHDWPSSSPSWLPMTQTLHCTLSDILTTGIWSLYPPLVQWLPIAYKD